MFLHYVVHCILRYSDVIPVIPVIPVFPYTQSSDYLSELTLSSAIIHSTAVSINRYTIR